MQNKTIFGLIILGIAAVGFFISRTTYEMFNIVYDIVAIAVILLVLFLFSKKKK